MQGMIRVYILFRCERFWRDGGQSNSAWGATVLREVKRYMCANVEVQQRFRWIRRKLGVGNVSTPLGVCNSLPPSISGEYSLSRRR